MFTDENKTAIIRTEAVAFGTFSWVCAEGIVPLQIFLGMDLNGTPTKYIVN